MRKFVERFLTPVGLAILLLFGLQSRSDAISGSCTTYRTWNTGDSLTAPDLTTSFQQVATTNMNGSCLAGHSPDVATMQTATDPYAGATEVLATSNDGELERIRFILQRMNGATSWYKENQFSGASGDSGRLTFVSTTQVKFCPFNGNLIRIPSTGKLYQIPSACTTAANTSVYVGGVAAQNLAASTTYWMYLFDLSGTLTADFWAASTHAADATTGIEIRSTDNTRVLIGMVRTNSSSQFEDDNALRGVLSYFNRRAIGLVNNFTAARTTTSATYVELNTEIRGNFLTWGDEAVVVGVSATVTNDTANNNTSTALAFDGTNQARASNITVTGTASQVVSIGLSEVENGLSEGFHFTTLLGASSSVHVGTWWGSAFVSNTTPVATTTLTVGIRG